MDNLLFNFERMKMQENMSISLSYTYIYYVAYLKASLFFVVVVAFLKLYECIPYFSIHVHAVYQCTSCLKLDTVCQGCRERERGNRFMQVC